MLQCRLQCMTRCLRSLWCVRRISVPPKKQMDNNNPKPEIERILRTVLENLRELAHTPSKPLPDATAMRALRNSASSSTSLSIEPEVCAGLAASTTLQQVAILLEVGEEPAVPDDF